MPNPFNSDSWKTTAGGWLFAALIIATRLLSHQPLDTQTLLLAAGFAGVGTVAGDAKK